VREIIYLRMHLKLEKLFMPLFDFFKRSATLLWSNISIGKIMSSLLWSIMYYLCMYWLYLNVWSSVNPYDNKIISMKAR